MELGGLLFSGPGGRDRGDADTAIADDILPTRMLDPLSPDTVADPTLMAAAPALAAAPG